MMRLPRFQYFAPPTLTEAAALLADGPRGVAVVAGGTDLLPEHEAAPADAARGDRPAQSRRCARVERSSVGVDARRDDAHAARARRASRAAWPALAQAARLISTPPLRNMGTLGGNLLPRHPLQLLRPELRVAERHRLLHEEGRRDLLGGAGQPALLGGGVGRHRAGADARIGAEVTLVSADGERRIPVARSVPRRRHRVSDQAARRDPPRSTCRRKTADARGLLEAAAARLVRLSGAGRGRRGPPRPTAWSRARHGDHRHRLPPVLRPEAADKCRQQLPTKTRRARSPPKPPSWPSRSTTPTSSWAGARRWRSTT